MLRSIFTIFSGLCVLSFVQGCNLTTYYHVSKTHIPWYNAVHECAAMGMRLATPHTVERMQAVIEAIDRANQSTHTWLGAQDFAKKFTFVWNTGVPTGPLKWMPGAPNNAGGNEDCLEIINQPSLGLNWHFNDNNCAVTHVYVCEVDACVPN